MLRLDVPLIRSYNYCMMNEDRYTKAAVTSEDFQGAIDKLLKLEHGMTVYSWLRRRTCAHHELVHGSELEGSSDVSCHMFELFKQQCHSGRNPRRILNDGFGFWINGEICDLMDIPRTTATEQYHNQERA